MGMIQLVCEARTLLCLDRNIPVRDTSWKTSLCFPSCSSKVGFFFNCVFVESSGWVYAALMTAVRLQL